VSRSSISRSMKHFSSKLETRFRMNDDQCLSLIEKAVFPSDEAVWTGTTNCFWNVSCDELDSGPIAVFEYRPLFAASGVSPCILSLWILDRLSNNVQEVVWRTGQQAIAVRWPLEPFEGVPKGFEGRFSRFSDATWC